MNLTEKLGLGSVALGSVGALLSAGYILAVKEEKPLEPPVSLLYEVTREAHDELQELYQKELERFDERNEIYSTYMQGLRESLKVADGELNRIAKIPEYETYLKEKASYDERIHQGNVALITTSALLGLGVPITLLGYLTKEQRPGVRR